MKSSGFLFELLLLIISISHQGILAVENPESFFKELEDVCPSGNDYDCKFCEPVDWKVDSKVCISLQYHPREYGFSVNLTWNEYDLNNEIIAAKNPALICGKVSKFLRDDLICIHVSNLTYEKNFHGTLEVSLGVCRLLDKFGNVGCLERHENPEQRHYHLLYWILPMIFILVVSFILSVRYFCYKESPMGSITTTCAPLIDQKKTIINNEHPQSSWAFFYGKNFIRFLSFQKASENSIKSEKESLTSVNQV